MNSRVWYQTGGIWPVGVPSSLTWNDLGAIAHILQAAQIRLVVEIGVEHGGLAAYLASHCHHTGCVYRGIDITLGALNDRVRDTMHDAIVCRDAWNPATVAEVAGWIAAASGPALIICDGGDKPRELRLYAPLLRTGDVLIGHDYGNEYSDAAIADVPASRVRTDWLDETLLCVFQAQ